MNRTEGEKALKRYLKRSVGFSLSILVGFLMTGQVSLGADINKELQIQDLLKSIQIEKEELNEKLLELDKELAIVKNSKDSSIQFFLSTLFENRKSKKSDDNGFSDVIDDWEDSIKDKPNINIPDIRDDVKPVVPDIPNPLPNEDSIVVEPDFDFEEIGNIAIGDVPNDIDINIDEIDLPVNEIKDGDFNIPTDGNISKPEIGDIAIGDINLPNIDSNITTDIQAPTIDGVNDLPTFNVPEIDVAIKDIVAPESFSLEKISIKGNGFNQNHLTGTVIDGAVDKKEPIVAQNYTRYEVENDKEYKVEFNGGKINYIGAPTGGDHTYQDPELLFWDKGEYKGHASLRTSFEGVPETATFISDVIDDDVVIKGNFNFSLASYGTNPYIRMFLSSNPAGVTSNSYDSVNKETVKVTELDGNLTLKTTNDTGKDFNGLLVGLEHQTWDKFVLGSYYAGLFEKKPSEIWNEWKNNFSNSYSVLVNSGTLKLGEDNTSENMIGIMVDLEQGSLDKNHNNKTINNGTIEVNGKNSIGISFEEYINESQYTENTRDEHWTLGNEKTYIKTKGHFQLRDDAYLGKINLNGNNNYGLRMGNIFSELPTEFTAGKYENSSKTYEDMYHYEFLTYFDNVKIIGNQEGGIQITDPDNPNNSKNYENYTSKITVNGNNNAGIVVGKSLSSIAGSGLAAIGVSDDDISKNNPDSYDKNKIDEAIANGKVNPIDNFINISIEVNGDKTIGFIRDRDYSNNNKNDMVITDKNINDIKFGNEAKNSVLFRSEMYGINNNNLLDVSGAGSNNKTNDFYNIAMQATRQSWDKDEDGRKDTNSSGSVINSSTISGTVNNMIGMMASGEISLEDGIDNSNWQNGDKFNNGKALATNTGTISLEGENNIGMAILDNNEGKNSGSIEVNGKLGIGVYNTGIFSNKIDEKVGTINVTGENSIGIYNKQEVDKINRTVSDAKLVLDGTQISIDGTGTTGIYSEGGEIDFGTTGTTITGYNNSTAGIYTKGNTTLDGKIVINSTMVGIASGNGTSTINSKDITYNGSDKEVGFALYTKGDNGKIVLNNSTLTLSGEKTYLANIDVAKKDDGINDNKAIELGGSTIKITNDGITLFNAVNNQEDKGILTISSEDEQKNFSEFVGEYKIDAKKDESGEEQYHYTIASIDGGTINIDSKDNSKNLELLDKYDFQRSHVNISQNLTVNENNIADEIIGIGVSSSSNIKTEGTSNEQQRAETQINITDSTLTANRTDKAPEISPENKNSKSTIGAYINYGEVNLTNGHIVVENSNPTNDVINDNGIGIYSKNGSKITTNENSSITVYGNNGIGIYAEATKDGENGKNKFGGDITQININNAGNITLSGESGVGIYADGGTGDKGTVTNSGNITVGSGTKENSSVGIYGINTKITNSGNITVGDKENTDKTGVGIYAVNSNVTAGGNITLGSNATGIYLDGNSNFNTENNKNLTFDSLEGNTTDRIGIYVIGEEGATNKDININFDIDMSNVDGGKAIVAKGREVTNSNTISISSENGRGMRALDNATITNNGTIEIGKATSTLQDLPKHTASIGMTAANTNGKIYNNGSININSDEEIGIYVENDSKDKTGNSIESIGTINLNGDKNIAVLTKGNSLDLDGTKLSTKNINFGNTSNNNIGIYADNSNITINEDISKTFTENQTNNILIAGVENSQITNNKTITVGTSNEKSSDTTSNNIGIYLKDGGSYKGGESGSIKVNNGNIGIYADNGAGSLENINITSDSMGIQTIGVVLNGENKENKNISGTVTLTNSNDEVVQGKNIGIYANNSNVIVEKTLTLNNAESNGTGLYLNNSTLSGNGTIKITGEGKENSEGKISNSVGIYYTSSDKENPIISDNQIKVEIDKSNTIGVYLANDTKLKKGKYGSITIGTAENITSNATGIVVGSTGELENSGAITLNNTEKSIGIASLGGKVINNGTITLAGNTTSDTGIYLSGNSELTNNGTITIEKASNSEGLGIGIYAKGENVKINSVGNFNMASGNVAIYSDGTNISSDIKLADSKNLEKNSGTIALVVKSDRDSTEDGVTQGTTIGGTDKDKMEITLAKGSTGIYALDSGVKISNVSISATANEGKNGDLLSYGIYLGAGKEGNTENYEIDNTDISLVKGVGIVVNTTDNNTDTSLTLSNSTLNINSYSEGDKAETGIGIYIQSGKITLAGGNTINTTYGVGIFGGKGSTVNVGNEKDTDILNIKGYSVGVYSKGGEINLGANTEINFQKGAAHGESTEVSKGVGAYVIDGNITSSASINTTNGVTSENVVGLLGKQTENNNTDITISNKGNITLAGNSVIGIAGLGSENSNGKVTITNEGEIAISGNEKNLSTGIYGENASINNTGTLTVGQFATGIFYKGTKDNNITSNDITLNGTDSMGAVLKGTAGDVTIGKINGLTDRSLGVYLDNYKSSNTEIGDITLENESMGLYINNSNTTINSIGNITVGKEGIGIASIGNSEDGTDIVTIDNNGEIIVGEKGTAVYVKDSTLNMDSLAGVKVGKNGTFIHVKDGNLVLGHTISNIEVNGSIGIIVDGGSVTSADGSNLEEIHVRNGGTALVVRGNSSLDNSIITGETKVVLESGEENGQYSVGVYYQKAGNINELDTVDIEYADGTSRAIGTIYDRTYGTLNNFNAEMSNSVSNSIGTIIRRNGNDKTDNDKSVTLMAGETKETSKGKDLINVNGQNNIGIIGKNSIIEANGDIKVGLDEASSGSIGIYLTASKDKTDENNKENENNDKDYWEHKYTGTGDINVGSHSYGIYAKNYDVIHNGNITASGEDSIGIASVILDDKAHGHTHTITVNDSILTVKDGAIGIFGRDTDIDVNNGKLEVSGENSTGIASIKDGNINFDGSATISGKGSAGIYKNTVLDNSNSNIKDESNNTITVGKGDWTIDNTASGIVAISREKNENGDITKTGSPITVNNSSNMTLGDGAIGIYSAGENIVNNHGAITVGGAVVDGDKTYASIGIYMANGVGNTLAKGTNDGNITVEKNGGVGIQVAGYVDFTNKGKIEVSDGAEGLHSSYGATITNEGNITVTGKGTGMIASDEDSQAINNGTINLEKDNTIVVEDGENPQYNTSLIGMAAVSGGHIINGEKGVINVNDGVGMYVDENSTFTNDGTINVNNGVGIMGVGDLINTGKIVVDSENSNAVGTVELDENLSDKGSLVVDRENGILEVNDNFSNIGGILETDFDIKLNNPTVDITQGGAGFDAPNISGDIKLDSNFALEGDGISFSVEDFIDPEADININTSPLFKTDINEGDLTVNKVDYKDITAGNQFDNRDDSLDNILAGGGVDGEILKKLNYYLDSLGNTTLFDSEADRMLGAIGGNIYSNIQSRMQDISRTFDNSFEEMVTAPNPTYENTKYSLIYTNGNYENTNEQVVDYDYDIKGLNVMREYDLSEQGKRYGYSFGFTGAKFKFDDFSESEEDVYSLRGGAHRISSLDNGLTWFTRAELGYNHHRVDRKVIIPGATENIENRAWYGSYQVSLDNKLRKEVFANENSNLGAYTALNLEYGLFDNIKESGNLELKVKSNDYFSSKAVIGLDGKFSKPINDSWAIRLNGDINYSYDFGDNYDENDVRFRTQDSYYSLASEVESRDVLSGKVSIGLDKSDYMSIALHAQAFRDFRRDEDYWNAGLTFTYRFNNHATPEKFLDMHNYFEFDKSDLNSKDKENIKEMAEYINKNNIQGTLLIEGHTDDTGRASYNDKLSLRRANSVKAEFEKNLTNKENIQVKVVGYGEDKPEYKNINESAKSKNRRTQINILNK